MRLISLIEAMLFAIAFVLVLLVILLDGIGQRRGPAGIAASTSAGRRMAGWAPERVHARPAAPRAKAGDGPSGRLAVR